MSDQRKATTRLSDLSETWPTRSGVSNERDFMLASLTSPRSICPIAEPQTSFPSHMQNFLPWSVDWSFKWKTYDP